MTFLIVQTRTTPQAEFKNGYLTIKGKSVPFMYPDFYDVIKDRLECYSKNPNKTTLVDFNLSAVNAISKRSLMNTFQTLEDLDNKGTSIKVNWFYQEDDEDMKELGEICRSNFNLKIDLHSTNY
jgi:hypothetical protein